MPLGADHEAGSERDYRVPERRTLCASTRFKQAGLRSSNASGGVLVAGAATASL
jgi:hypothetical protein